MRQGMGPEDGMAEGAAETTVERVAVVGVGDLTVATGGRTPLTDPTLAYLASLAPKSRATMIERLKAVATLIHAEYETMVWHELRFPHLEFIRQRMLERGAAPATVNLTLAALRGIAGYARDLNLLSAEDYDRIRRVKRARGERLPAGRSVLSGELGALVRACAVDPSPAGARDAAIFAALYIGGVRRSELAGLELGDYIPEPPALRVRAGKGNKAREVPLTASAAAVLADWLAVRGDRPGGLFLPINKGGRLAGERMSSRAIYTVLDKRRRQAGVERLSPHDFRRTFVGDLLDAGVDLSTVQRLAGHADPSTTARYDRRGEAAKRRAVEVLHFPAVRRRA